MHSFSTFRLIRSVSLALALLAAQAAATVIAAPQAEPDAGAKKYTLRYKFKAGEVLRWEVEHRAQIRTTIQGTTQTAETVSTSIKIWKVDKVDDRGQATFTYSVESVDMRQKYDGRKELHYNSDTDKEAPPGFGDVAKAVGVPLAEVTLDNRGKLIKREEKRPSATPAPEAITPPLPEEPVAVGAEWFTPADIKVTLKTGEVKKIKARQRYELESVKDQTAVIALATQILSPIRDNPEIEAQVVQSLGDGHIRFAIDDGRILSQQSDVDERVNGFQGEASSLHCVTRFTEKLLPADAQTARHTSAAGPVAGPVAGPIAGPLAKPPAATTPKAASRQRRKTPSRR
jgi:hypothetical protein